MAHKISVDKEKCIGCGACAATCPGSFKMKGAVAVAVKGSVDELSCEKDAVAGCPVGAIVVG